VTVENFVRRNAHFFAAHIDWGIGMLFPKRLQGDYTVRGASAASTGEAVWSARRVDTTGDCKVDANDDPTAFPVYAYTRADGSNGPRIPVVGEWFNNRRSVTTIAFGTAGLLLADPELVSRAKRYVMEWLTYSVFPDGSEGEYLRNGDYCIPNQGVIYSAQNVQGGMILARLLARQGDGSLTSFSTKQGLFGTESGSTGRAKSLELVASTHVGLRTRSLPWYFREAQKPIQAPRAATFLGEMESHYMGGPKVTDNYHELGMLVAASVTPAIPITGLLLRDPKVTTLRFPGSTGNPVATGWGNWSDAFGALPAPFLMRQ
jgi:hypothetical protein